MTLHCKQCGHQWESYMPIPISLDRATKIMAGAAAAGCPECKSFDQDVLVGPTPPPKEPKP